LNFKLKQRFKKKDLNRVLNLELSHHMEQIQIRQPKMPAAQSFIQKIRTFLASLLIFIAVHFSYIKKILFNKIKPKPLLSLDKAIKNQTLFIKKKKDNGE